MTPVIVMRNYGCIRFHHFPLRIIYSFSVYSSTTRYDTCRSDADSTTVVLPVLYPGIILYAVSYDNIIPSFITFLKLSCIFYRIREERGERREYHFYFTYSKSLSK